ncbi:MAG TPA: ribosome maturation factor RimP [Chromatiales bacterium]|nr:ribosome maturation factor RimP [Chromatiales bacterium]
MSQKQAKVQRLIEPVVTALGYELYDLELQVGRGHGVLRLFIDCDSGVGLEDCERVSRQVSAVLDVEDPVPGHYDLEVSSPGLDRKLVRPEHFDRFAGSEISVRLWKPVDGQRKFRGRLLHREDGRIEMQLDDRRLMLPIDDIAMARLVPDLDNTGKGRGSGKTG